MPAHAGIHAFLATPMTTIKTAPAQPNRIPDTINKTLASLRIPRKPVIASASKNRRAEKRSVFRLLTSPLPNLRFRARNA